MSNIVDVRDKLRRLDVASGFVGKVAEEHVATICKDLAFNEVAGLLAVVEAAQLFIAAPRCQRKFMSFGHEHCTSAGNGCDVHQWLVLKHSLRLFGDS